MRITLDHYKDNGWEINFKPEVGRNINFKLEEDENLTSEEATTLAMLLTKFNDIYVDVNFTAYKDDRED